MSGELIYSVTDFVAICNQVLDVSFGLVKISGELTNFKISKSRWVYFDLKDEYSSLRFFGTVHQLPGPLEDGLVLTVRGVPNLHPKFGFSISVKTIQLSGEGTIKKATQLLELKLKKEGLFDVARKRVLPYPPKEIGIISSIESAGYADFIKIMNERWSGLIVNVFDVQVQGEKAPDQIIDALQYFNQKSSKTEVLVLIRGGGSAEDLQAFNHEAVTRAVASSRILTLVAIGHETDISLAERVADLRASTPSNAAQLLLPEKNIEYRQLQVNHQNITKYTTQILENHKLKLTNLYDSIFENMMLSLNQKRNDLKHVNNSLQLLNPNNILKRGYTIVRQNGLLISRASMVDKSNDLEVQFYDERIKSKPIKIR